MSFQLPFNPLGNQGFMIMGKKGMPIIYQRAEQLPKLIQDAKEMNFDPELIRNYEMQLQEIQAELPQRKKVRVA